MASPVGFRSSTSLSSIMTPSVFPVSNDKTDNNTDQSNMIRQDEDLVFVRDLFVKAMTGADAWRRPEPQPVNISVYMKTSVAKAGSTDHLTYSLNYAVVTRKVTKMVETSRFKSLEDIAESVAKVVLSESVGGQWAKIQVKKPRALLRADASEIEITRVKKNTANGKYEIIRVPNSVDIVRIHNLRLVTIIGVNKIERMYKQNITLGLTLYKTEDKEQGFNKKYDFRKVVDQVITHVEDSSYKTVEAFVTSVAQVVCEAGVSKVTVRAEKPSAITFADAAGVEITRVKGDFVETQTLEKTTKTTEKLFPDSKAIEEKEHDVEKKDHTVFIAFGSNIGSSLSAISSSIGELEKRGIKVLHTSGIYESEPMYVVDQPKFYNGVFKATTQLTPLNLLKAVKEIEYETFGRIKKQENGPRSIDLDILLYDDWVVNEDTLTIPHLSMLERNFVLKPLKDVTTSKEAHPLTAEEYHSHFDQLLSTKVEDQEVQKSMTLKNVVPLPLLSEEFVCYKNNDGEQEERKIVFDSETSTVNTHAMAVLNVTPDSFSDGGRFTQNGEISYDSVSSEAVKAINSGATILDIGGMSTRPGVKDGDVSIEEEINRVVPAIKAIRQKFAELANKTQDAEKKKQYQNVVISVDTYRSKVVEESVKAGADLVNDISGGLFDDSMFSTVAKLQVPIVIGHTRHTLAGSNSTDNKVNGGLTTKYEWVNEKGDIEVDTEDAVINNVRRELNARVNKAFEQGIKRWQIILDPGIGFSKNFSQNMAVIRNFSALALKRVVYNNRGRKHGAAGHNAGRDESEDAEESQGEEIEGLPWLIGTSRKKFIGTITGKEEAKDRVFGTAATVTALVGQGADIVRIHDVDAMIDVIKVSDEIYRKH